MNHEILKTKLRFLLQCVVKWYCKLQIMQLQFSKITSGRIVVDVSKKIWKPDEGSCNNLNTLFLCLFMSPAVKWRDCLRDEHSLQGLWFFSSQCYLGGGPRPRPGPGPWPGGPLGPGARFTGPRVLGLADARATSFSSLTPLPADPGFVLVGVGSGSGSEDLT